MKKFNYLLKRGLALFLALTMCLSLVQVTAMADDAMEDEVSGISEVLVETGTEQNALSESTQITAPETESTQLPEDVAGNVESDTLDMTDGISNDTEAQPSEAEEPEAAPVCICETKCTEYSRNIDCPVCNAENADLIVCTGEEAVVEIPTVVQVFLDAVVRLEMADPADEETCNLLGQAAMNAYAAVQAAGLEGYEGVGEALARLMALADRQTGGAATMEETGLVTTAEQLQDAINNAAGADTVITLGADIDVPDRMQFKYAGTTGFTLDLNSHTISGSVPGSWALFEINDRAKASCVVFKNGTITSTGVGIEVKYAGKIEFIDVTIADCGNHGIKISGTDIAVLTNVTITGIKSQGCALDCAATDLTMTNCTIRDNGHDFSGAMLRIAPLAASGTQVLTNCTIEDNHFTAKNSNIVGLYTGAIVTLDSCTIRNNSAGNVGGIICSQSKTGASLRLTNGTVVSGNTGNSACGGIHAVSAPVVVDPGCAVYDNAVANPGIVNAANDISVNAGCTVTLPAASEMADKNEPSVDFSGFAWVGSDGQDLQGSYPITVAGKAALKVDMREVFHYARIGETEYTSVADAFTAVEPGGTIDLINNPKMNGNVPSDATLITKPVALNLNDCTLTFGGWYKVDNGGSLTLAAQGKLDGHFQVKDGGVLQMQTFEGTYEGLRKAQFWVSTGGTFAISGKLLDYTTVTLDKDSRIWAGSLHDESDRNFETIGTIYMYLTQAAADALQPGNSMVLIDHCDPDKTEAIAAMVKLDTSRFPAESIVLVRAKGDQVVLEMLDVDKNTEVIDLSTITKGELLSKVENGGSFLMKGTMEVNDFFVLDGGNATLMRHPLEDDAKKAMFNVTNGGSLTLTNITLDGAFEKYGLESKSALVNVNGGSLTIDEGAKLQNNYHWDNNIFAANGGAVRIEAGSAAMVAGEISGNYAYNGGGVAVVARSTEGVFYFSGGSIHDNSADTKRGSDEFAGKGSGGGVFIADNSRMVMSGGTVSGNHAYIGGGIGVGGYSEAYSDEGRPTLEMENGLINGNSTENCGGGIYVQMNGVANISQGTISNNHADSGEFGGGGIYVNGGKTSTLPNGQLNLSVVEITDNAAGGYGAAIAGCETSQVKVFVDNGAVIHGNRHTSDTPDVYIKGDNMGTGKTPEGYLSPFMLGGAAYRWYAYTKDGTREDLPLNNSDDKGLISAYGMFMAWTDMDSSSVTDAVKSAIKVRIVGNISSQNGGGIGTNGDVTIGSVDTFETPLTVAKIWQDNDDTSRRPEKILVDVLNRGEVIGVLVLSEVRDWETAVTTLPASINGVPCEYTVKERAVPGYTGTETQGPDGLWTITNTLAIDYWVVHEYYTNGTKDGTSSPMPFSGSMGSTISAGDIEKVSGYNGSQYSYTSSDKSSITLTAGSSEADRTITLRYDRTTSSPQQPGNPPVPTFFPTPTPTGTSITDNDVPLAAPGLNSVDHFAYIIGYTDGTVRPEANITRAEVATIFFRLMTDDFRTENWATENTFSDVNAGDWFNNGVSTSAKAQIIKGYEDGTFRPNRKITRAEFAAIAARFLSDEVTVSNSFSDISGHWAEDAINRAVKAGWIQGYSDGTFRPDQYITRAEAVTMINRMLDRTPDKDHLLPNMVRWTDNTEDKWYYAAMQEATNSHDYEREEMILIEDWTELLENRDWEKLEKDWSNAASAPGGEVADNLDLSKTGDDA